LGGVLKEVLGQYIYSVIIIELLMGGCQIPIELFLERPNYDRLVSVLWLEDEIDRVPFYEHLVDLEVIEHLLRVKLRRIDMSRREGKVNYLRYLVKFFKSLRYDCVPFELPLKLPRNNVLFTEDTARLSRGFRRWLDEHRGVIMKMIDFESYPWPNQEDAIDYEMMEILCKILPENMGVVGGVGGGIFEHTVWLMGFTPFFKALYCERKLVEAMFRRIGKLITDVLKVLAEYDKIVILRMGDDLGSRNGTFISPSMLRKYIFPWYREAVKIAHKHGKPFILHSCGNLSAIVNDLIDWVGIDGKHSYEDTIMPVTEAKRLYGSRIAILGGIDVDKLSRYPKDEFTSYVKEVMRKCCPGGGYALGSGNSITNYVDINNYLEMLKLGVKYGKYFLKV